MNKDLKITDLLANNSPIICFLKKGGIHIKPENKGKFTSYCGGKVTSECIAKGKKSKDPKIRKRATFAANARRWKHQKGGAFKSFEEFYNAIPEDKRDTINYRLRRAYELAPKEDLKLFTTGTGHLNSIYFNSTTGDYEFMKSPTHPTIWAELHEYYSNPEFNTQYELVREYPYYRYILKTNNK